jgi:signal transduction histidine kinase
MFTGYSDPPSVEARTEVRLARMVVFTRVATSAFVVIPPVFAWHALRYPWLAVAIAVGAVVEANVVRIRLRRTGTTQDRLVLGIDVGFCLALMVVGSQAATPATRTTLMTVLLPFSLVCSALLGFGIRRDRGAVVVLLLLGGGWAATLYPNYTVKIASDLLGFALWYVVARLIARELRGLARTTAAAQEEAIRLQDELAARTRQIAVERERALAHRAIHDHLLPVVAQVAADQTDLPVREAARQGLQRARRFLADEEPGVEFAAAAKDLCTAYPEAEAVLEIEHEPPPEVGDTVLAAAREALTNARTHAGGATNLYVRSTSEELLVTVRDRGTGFDPESVRVRGGLGRTFPAVEKLAGSVEIISGAAGTKIVIRWPAAP